MKKLIIFFLSVILSLCFFTFVSPINSQVTIVDVSETEKAHTDSLTDVHTLVRALQDSLTNVHERLVVAQDSINAAYQESYEAEKHFHNREHWHSRHPLPTASVVSDTSGFYPFQLTAAADSTFGSEVQVLGTSDTPVFSESKYYDFHRLFVTNVSEDTPYRLRIVWGSTFAAGMAAEQYTDITVSSDKTNPQQAASFPFDIIMRRIAVGTAIWMQCANPSGAETIDFIIGCHEYAR